MELHKSVAAERVFGQAYRKLTRCEPFNVRGGRSSASRGGLAALVDKRPVRRRSLTGWVDPRYMAVFRQVLKENMTASTGTSTRLKWLVD
jgi:hypothetical protein